MSREVLVTRIEAAPDATIQKRAVTKSRSHYVFPILYHLEDGTTVEGRSTHTHLRDAKDELASLPKAPTCLTRAKYGDDGEFWGITWTIAVSDLLRAQQRM